MDAIQKVKASKAKAARNRDNWKAKAIRGEKLIRKMLDLCMCYNPATRLEEEIKNHLKEKIHD